jgi:hypothetical protein
LHIVKNIPPLPRRKNLASWPRHYHIAGTEGSWKDPGSVRAPATGRNPRNRAVRGIPHCRQAYRQCLQPISQVPSRSQILPFLFILVSFFIHAVLPYIRTHHKL